MQKNTKTILLILGLITAYLSVFSSAMEKHKPWTPEEVQSAINHCEIKVLNALESLNSYEEMPRSIVSGERHWETKPLSDWTTEFWLWSSKDVKVVTFGENNVERLRTDAPDNMNDLFAMVYNKTFNIDFEPQQENQYFLQLGSVKDVGIAEVKINGKEKGVLWTAPFRVEISDELQKGENTLEIEVVNSWYNRVAGDQTFLNKKQYTSTNIDLKHDYRGRPIDEIPLEPSGLLGPVTIEEAKISF